MKKSQGILYFFVALTLSVTFHSDKTHAGNWCSSTQAVEDQVIGPECASYDPDGLKNTVNELRSYLVFLKDQDVNWNLSTLSLLGKFLKDYRIQESIWLLNRHQKFDVADLLEYQLKQVLMCAPEAKKEPLGGGATQTWLISFDHGVESEQQIRAVYKPHQANLSSHVGAEVATRTTSADETNSARSSQSSILSSASTCWVRAIAFSARRLLTETCAPGTYFKL